MLKQDDGHNVFIQITITPIEPGFGSNLNEGYVLLISDISKKSHLKEENEFVSVVSHELRTPIATAEGNIGNAEFIATKNQVNESVVTSIREAHRQINYLSKLINDLSTLSRAENNKLDYEVNNINVNKLITQLNTQYQDEAKQKNINIITDIDPSLELLSSSEDLCKRNLRKPYIKCLKIHRKRLR
jgi:signal transduction histidine kinase